jgi:hypothetical protein
MKRRNSIMQMITSPLCAAVVCPVGGFAIWFYTAQPPQAMPKAKPEVERSVVRPAIAEAPSARRGDSAPQDTRRDKFPDALDAHSAVVSKQRTAAQKTTAAPREIDETKLTSLTTDTAQRTDEVEESKQTDLSPDKEPEQVAPNSSEPASPKDAKYSPTSPEGVLDSHGLRKLGSFYIVATEKEIGEGFFKIRPIYNVMETALGNFQAILNAEMTFLYWDNERTLAQTYIGDLNITIANIPNTIPNRPTIQAYRNELQGTQLYLNNVLGSLEIARKNLVPPARKQAVWNEFMKLRAEFLEANKQLRPIVDKANAEYLALEKVPAVKDALQTLSERSNSRLRLGPSKNAKTWISNLIRAEEMVSFDPDAYRRKTKRKSKISKKADVGA